MATGEDDSMKTQLARLDSKVQGIDKQVARLDKRFDGVDKRFNRLDKRLDCLDNRVDGLAKKVDNLASSTKVQFETIRDDIRKLGEGYESGLKFIATQMANLDKKWAVRWSLHDAALKNHAGRITTLEQLHANRGDR